MRTTLEIDDDVLERVKLRAKHEHTTTGRLLSQLARRQLDAPPDITMKNGIPVLRSLTPGTVMITTGQVQQMLDDLLLEESGL